MAIRTYDSSTLVVVEFLVTIKSQKVGSSHPTSLIQSLFFFFFLGCEYTDVSLPSVRMIPAATSDLRSSAGVIDLAFAETSFSDAMGSSTTDGPAFFVRMTSTALALPILAFPVASVGAHVPESEDVSWVSDADLDVCFVMNPTSWPDAFRIRRNIHASACLYRR